MISVLQLGNPTGMYGAERWILALAKHLDTARIRTIVGVIRDDGSTTTPALTEHVLGAGIEAVIFDAPGRMSRGAVGQVRRYIREQNVAVLHTHGYKTDIIGRLAVRGTSCRIVSTPHGWSQDAGLVLQMYELLDRIVFLFMDRVVPLSDELFRGLSWIPGLRRKLRLIRNGVDISEIDAERANRGSTPGSPTEFKVGYIGQLINRKRIDTLLLAFASSDVGEKRLLIVGDGPQRAEYEGLAADLGLAEQVEFLGFREDRLSYLLNFDVFVLPSELEGIPRCVLEAMAAGVCVIASDIPGSRDVVIDGETGLLFDMGESAQLARAIEKVAGDAVLRSRLADSGRRLVMREYSAQRMADEYADLFAEIVRGDAVG